MPKEDSSKNFSAQPLVEFLIVAFILCFVGTFAHIKIQERIDSALEQSIRRHIETISHSIDREIRQQFVVMESLKRLIKEKKCFYRHFKFLSKL